MNRFMLIPALSISCVVLMAQHTVAVKPRIIISTDIGGTDPDDNQSMAHFLMYSNLFQTEGLISSPSYGHGSKKNILDMIDLYEKDLPKLQKHAKGYPLPAVLRTLCKQGRHGAAPFAGYGTPTEGSDWIVKRAKTKSNQPLWVLVWGGLDDLAQALHDAPEIQSNIRIYWIGGPNKKWSTNSYAYIAQNFPNLWFIEVNSSYYGFFSSNDVPDSLKNENYYSHYIDGAGHLGKDFKDYYEGNVKMGDTPSLLYMMDGDPNDPLKACWGGSFEKMNHSPRIIFERSTTTEDTLTVCSIIEFHLKGPNVDIPSDSACVTLSVQGEIGEQKWKGFHLGGGQYVVRYAPKQTETLMYKITSDIPGFPEQDGKFVVDNSWPGKHRATDYALGPNWYTDRTDQELFDGTRQGAKTVRRWRSKALLDWAERWQWIR